MFCFIHAQKPINIIYMNKYKINVEKPSTHLKKKQSYL